jgi:hypothetical protein
VDIDIKEGKAVIETEEGTVAVDASARSWPDEIPGDVPKFRDGKINSVTTNSSPEGEGWTLVLTEVTTDAAKDYAAKLKEKGFTTHTVMVDDTGGSISGEKDNIIVYLMVSEGTGTYSVQIQN